MDSTLPELSRDTKNTKIGVRTKKLCKFQNLKKINKHCSTFNRRGYYILTFSEMILAHIASRHIWIDSTLQELSNGTNNTQIGVCMTKLWPYEFEAKTGDCSNFAMLQKQSIPTSRHCCTTSRRSGLVLGGLLAHFEPIMEGFKAKTVGIKKEDDWERFF